MRRLGDGVYHDHYAGNQSQNTSDARIDRVFAFQIETRQRLSKAVKPVHEIHEGV